MIREPISWQLVATVPGTVGTTDLRSRFRLGHSITRLEHCQYAWYTEIGNFSPPTTVSNNDSNIAPGDNTMRFAQAFGLGILLCSVGLVLGGGIGIPKKEDVPKYLTQLKTSKVAADRAKAAEMLGKRGSINVTD